MTEPEMELRTTLTSPFGRKVRMAAIVLGLADRIRLRPADTLDPRDDLRVQNPLGKMPCLVTEGTALFDSRVILDYLDGLAGGQLLPASGLARAQAATRCALADGVADAALLMVYDERFRDDSSGSARWLAHQAGKIGRALVAFEADPPPESPTGMVAICLACALGYLDWRAPVAWRQEHPRLVTWLDAFAAREPAWAATERPT